MSDFITEQHGEVAVLTLNRPQAMNALTPELVAEAGAFVRAFDKDKSQKVLVVTGAGEKAFCSGGDLSAMDAALDAGDYAPTSPQPDMIALSEIRKPVICAVNGLAIGGGMEIAMCSDIRLAAEHAWFGLPEVGHGFIAGVAAVMAPRMLPLGVVMSMMLAGERLSAAEAKQIGFVQKVLPAGELMAEAMKMAEKMCRHSQPAMWGTKLSVRFWHDLHRAQHQQHYDALVQRVMLAGDMREGLAAFAEKRKPHFTLNEWPSPFAKAKP